MGSQASGAEHVTDRNSAQADFLSNSHWSTWAAEDLAGDASQRKYYRLRGPNDQTAVLMDADPNNNPEQAPFISVAKTLNSWGVSTPNILKQDLDAGFILMEDLGDQMFADVIAANPSSETTLYSAAVDLLVTMHKHPCPKLPLLGPRLMAEMTSLAFTEYRGAILGDTANKERARFEDLFETILSETLHGEPVFVHRDFHAENLIWLPEREAIGNVGVIDFQDARLGHKSYDLVSLLQDARRDVPAGIEARMIDRYISITKSDEAEFRTAYAVVGFQRNMRILGIFARLSKRYGKTKYLELIPRVWGHFIRGLEHPAMAPVVNELLDLMPEPNPANLDKLRPEQA